MSMSIMYYKRIVDRIIKSDCISVEIVDNLENIYDRILFYDENDEVIPDSKEYRDAHRKHYLRKVERDMKNSFKEYKNIPKFKLNGQKFEEVIDELVDYINELGCINC